MGILEQLINPPSADHVALLNIIQILSLLLFIPFIGMVLGSVILSVYFRYNYRKTSNADYLRLSAEIADKLTISRNVGWGMGIVPVFSITIVYAQLLYGAKVASTTLLLLATVLYIAALIFVYNYKNTNRISKILADFKNKLPSGDNKEVTSDVQSFENEISSSNTRSGNLAMYLLLIASFLFCAGISVAIDFPNWENSINVFSVLANGSVWINFLYFIALSFSITGIAILYFFFIWQGGVKDASDDYKSLAKKTGVNIALVSSLILPVLFAVNFVLQPEVSYNSLSFLFAGLTLLSVLLTCNFLYAIIRNSEIKYASPVFFLIFVTVTFSVFQQQGAFGHAVKSHLYVVNQKAEEIAKDKSNSVISTTGISGEEIFNTRCVACHKFDEKLVGPPYKETIPKYNGDLKKLAAFIYNPQKVNAAYPPMPSQGLKQKEAEAVAKYIMEKVSSK